MNFLKKLVLATTIAGSVMFSNKLLTQEPKLPIDLTKISGIVPKGLNAKEVKYISDTTNFTNADSKLAGSFIYDGEIEKNGNKWNLKISSIQYSQDYRFYYNQTDANIISLYGSIHDDNALKMRITSVNSDYSKVEMESMDSMSKVQKVEFRNGWSIDNVLNNNLIKNHEFKDWISLVSNIKPELVDGKTTYTFTLGFKRDFNKPIIIKLLDSTENGRLQMPIANVCFTAPIMQPEWRMKLTTEQNKQINLATTTCPNPLYVYADTVLANALVGRMEKLDVIGEITNAFDVDYPEVLTNDHQVYDHLRKIYGTNLAHPNEFVFGMQDNNGKVFTAYKSRPEDGLASDTAYHRNYKFASMGLGHYDATEGYVENRNLYHKDSVDISVKSLYYPRNRIDTSVKPIYYPIGFKYDCSSVSKDTITYKLFFMPSYTSLVGDSVGTNYVKRIYYNFKFVKDSLNRFIVSNNEFEYNQYTNIWSYKYIDTNGRYERYYKFSNNDSSAYNSNNIYEDPICVAVLNDTTIRIMYGDMIRPILASSPYETAQPFHGVQLIKPENNDLFLKPDSLHFSWATAPEGYKHHFYLSLYDDIIYNPIVDSLMQDTSITIRPPEQTPETSVRYYWGVMAENNDGGVTGEIRPFTVKDTLTVGVNDVPTEDFQIFPNPSNNESIVRFPETRINETLFIYNQLGNEVKNIPVSSGETELRFDSSDLPSGAYDIHLGKKHMKLMIVR